MAKVLFNTFKLELTAAGTVPEFDRIPFYLNKDDCFDTKINCKSMEKNNASQLHFKSFYQQIEFKVI